MKREKAVSDAFVGRKEELAALDQWYRSRRSGFIPIYGRRRVGKSQLILEFTRGLPTVYFLGKEAPGELQIREFLRVAAQALNEPLLATQVAAEWKTALTSAVDHYTGKKKLVLVLDEFQWTVGSSPELPSVIQECWDRSWRDSGKVMLILCGSYVGFMEREILGRQSPLFGRRTGQILLGPFGFREAAQFHPSYSLVDRAKTYFLCGGIPLYLNYFDSQRSVEANLAASLLSQYAPLYREPDFLLREELRDVDNYYAVLMAIAHGATTNQKIAAYTKIDPRSLHYYLKQIEELGYLRRRYPLRGKKPAGRTVRYVLDDPLLRFWFRFVYPNTSYIAQMGAADALRNRIRPELDSYYGTCFESLCREALPALYARDGLTANFEVGEYWDKATQIDVVGWRDDGWTDLGECKWGTVRSRKGLEDELEERIRRYPNQRNATIGRHVFVRKIPRAASSSSTAVQWHSLEDLYGPL